jgi:hypothetical protein
MWKNEAWIVDYKSSRRDRESGIHQIYKYIDIIKDIYPAHFARGFIVYIDDVGVEELSGNCI